MSSNLPEFQYQPNLFGLMSEQTPTYLDWLKRRNLSDAQAAVPFAQMTGQALPNVAPPAMPPARQAGQPAQPQGLDITDATTKLNKLIDSLHPDDSGVLGLGISKPQAMLFALSALLTRKMPQHQALEAGLKLMELPRLTEAAKQQAVLGQIRGLLGLTEVKQKSQELQQAQVLQRITEQLMAKKGISVPGVTNPPMPTTVQPQSVVPALPTSGLEQAGGPTLATALGGTPNPPVTPLSPIEREPELVGFTGGKPDIKFVEPPLTYSQIRQLPYVKSDMEAELVAGMPKQQQHDALMALQRQHAEEKTRNVPLTESQLLIWQNKFMAGDPVPEFMKEQFGEKPETAVARIASALKPIQERERRQVDAAERQAKAAEEANKRAGRVHPSLFEHLLDIKSSYNSADRLYSSFLEALKSTNGRIPSDVLATVKTYRTNVLPNITATTITQPLIAKYTQSLSPAWKTHVSMWMRELASVKNITGMSRPALQEWQFVMNAIGSPVEGKEMYLSNLATARQTLASRYIERSNDLGYMYPEAKLPPLGKTGDPLLDKLIRGVED